MKQPGSGAWLCVAASAASAAFDGSAVSGAHAASGVLCMASQEHVTVEASHRGSAAYLSVFLLILLSYPRHLARYILLHVGPAVLFCHFLFCKVAQFPTTIVSAVS